MSRRVLAASLALALAAGACPAPAALAAEGAEGPALAVESLEFLPGQGRAARSFLLHQFAGEDEAYLDLWDAVQILQANRYFDPVTRKVALGLGGNRVKLTDGSDWIFVDGRPRLLGAPCRIHAGRFYLPLSFWPVLLEELPGLPLRRDPESLRLIGGLSAVNVRSVEWIYAKGRLRGVFQLSEPLAPSLERRGERLLVLRFPGGRLADFDWERLPPKAPVDSLRTIPGEEETRLELYFRRPLGDARSAGDPLALTWAFTADLQEDAGLPEPDFAGELPERLPGEAAGGLERIVLDPGHGGTDTGAVAGRQVEKDWNLRLARWLAPHLEAEGFTVLWTRREDRDRRASHRAQAANVAGGDLFLSLHFTRRGPSGQRGLEIVLQDAQASLRGASQLSPWPSVPARHAERSLELAASLQRSLGVLTDWPQLGIRRERTAVLDGLDMPALLVEAGNLDDPAERSAWEDPGIREQRLKTLAQALAYRARRWAEATR
jgi:N-acetylmuramoyl-L-alanine amidase